MGAASASSQSSAMPQSQGKGGGAPMKQGGVGAPMSGGKGFSNQQPYSPNSGYANQGSTMPPAFQQLSDQIQPDDGSQVGVSSAGGPFGQFTDQMKLAQSTQANAQAAMPTNGAPMPQGQGKGASPQGNQITYPSTSGQQQFGQPMQSTQNPYSNTIGQGQQSNQMGSSGKGKGA